MISLLRLLLFLLLLQLIPSTGKTQELTPVTLQLKWKHQFQFAGYYAAIEKGFYEDAGLEVKLVEAVEGQNSNEAVFNGKAEFGVCTSDILMMKAKGHQPVVLATIFQHSPLILLASQKSGINHIQDLPGKRIALEPNTADIIAYMSDEGVPLEKCILDNHEFDVNKLIRGEVDAISAYSTDEPFALIELKIPYTIISPVMGGIDFYGDGLFTTDSLMRNNPDLVSRFREASLKGWTFAMEHPEEIIDLIYEKYSQRHSKAHLLYEAIRTKNLIMSNVVEIGYTNPGRIASIAETYKKVKMLDPEFSVYGLLYADYKTPESKIPWNLILIFSGILLVVGSAAWFFYVTSIKLKKEIQNREQAENEKRLALDKLRTLSLAIEQSPVTTVITDMNGNIEFANPKFTETTGYSIEEAIGQNSRIFKSGNKSKDDYKSLWETILSGKNWQGVFQNRRKNGELYWESAIISPVKDENGTISHFLAVKEDITERKKAETEISLKNEELQKLNAEKDKFFSIISHDLRNPFNGFLGLTHLLAKELPHLTTEEIQDYAVSLNHSAETLYKLLEDLLDWARMQQGLIPFAPENHLVSHLIERSLGSVKEAASAKKIGITVSHPENLIIYADENSLMTILRNLISNAIKFTPPGGKVSVTATEHPQTKIEFCISDSGIGMSQDLIDNLFSLTAKTGRKGTEGEASTGLGLLLCKEFVEKHGGTIRVTSEPDNGSSFYFTIPIR
ncbi:MAG: ABC transporter substrate-binding protein [Bacteroidetes bacterium]|nr:ABC transporter substrate-binding protein [Bacteroidota bacterium]